MDNIPKVIESTVIMVVEAAIYEEGKVGLSFTAAPGIDLNFEHNQHIFLPLSELLMPQIIQSDSGPFIPSEHGDPDYIEQKGVVDLGEQ